MQLERIVTLANRAVRLRFLAMERSLRAVGCQLPLLVIPYDDDRFDLPSNASWWDGPEIRAWLTREKAHPTMAKYNCLTIANYQFVDCDLVFLRDPQKTLAPHTGFITSCGHWHNPGETVTRESARILREKSSCWQRSIFNTGQFACDRALYTPQTLSAACNAPGFVDTCLRFRFHEQPGLVLLANHSGVPISNLTLPPTNMESTWAGDYPGEDFTATWRTEELKPYLIHWAGCHMNTNRPIDRLFIDFLTQAEQSEWREQVKKKAQRDAATKRKLSSRARTVVRGVRAFRDSING